MTNLKTYVVEIKGSHHGATIEAQANSEVLATARAMVVFAEDFPGEDVVDVGCRVGSFEPVRQ
jgi:murein DD-endopeptidase MepM/ murein hydrolase activator NlpD